MTAPEPSEGAPFHAGSSHQPSGPAKPAGRWMRVAFAVSLAINLGIGGLVAGSMLRDGGPMKSRMLAADVGFGPFTDALSKDDRAGLRAAFLAAAPEMRETRQSMQTDFKDLLGQLRAVPFDPAALRASFERQNTRNADRLQLGQRLIFDLLVGMKDAERQAFATRLETSLSKGPKRRERHVNP